MPFAYKILGQISPNDSSYTALYTAPAATSSIVSTITVCNQRYDATRYRIAILPSGTSTPTSTHFIAYDAEINPFETQYITIGATLGAGDKIVVFSFGTPLSFAAFGTEVS